MSRRLLGNPPSEETMRKLVQAVAAGTENARYRALKLVYFQNISRILLGLDMQKEGSFQLMIQMMLDTRRSNDKTKACALIAGSSYPTMSRWATGDRIPSPEDRPIIQARFLMYMQEAVRAIDPKADWPGPPSSPHGAGVNSAISYGLL